MTNREKTVQELENRWQEKRTEAERRGEKLGAELRYRREVRKLRRTVEKETSAYKNGSGEETAGA